MKKTFGFVATTLLISLAFLPGCSTYSNSIHSIPKEVDNSKVISFYFPSTRSTPSNSIPSNNPNTNNEIITETITETNTNIPQDKATDQGNPSGPSHLSLTEAQLQKVLKENSISPLAVENIGRFTIVLYKSDGESNGPLEESFPENMGKQIRTLRLTSDSKGNIIYGGGGGFGDNTDTVPVSIGASTSKSGLGYVGYVEVIINDLDLRKNAHKVECIFDNDLKTSRLVENQEALIIPFPPEKAQFNNVVITDQEGKVLFDKNEFLKQSRKWW